MRHFRIVDNKNPQDLLTLEALLTPPITTLAEREVIEFASELVEATVEYLENKLVVRLSKPEPTIIQNQGLLFPEMKGGETERE